MKKNQDSVPELLKQARFSPILKITVNRTSFAKFLGECSPRAPTPYQVANPKERLSFTEPGATFSRDFLGFNHRLKFLPNSSG
jgi:hypothetical protein